MLAVLFALTFFLVWSLLGLAALVALGADVKDLRVALTGPMLGSALTVVPLFVLNNAGVPMEAGARPVSIVLLVGSLVVLAMRRPRLSLALAPVVVICVCDVVLLGRPMFHFGFDWIANANPDMAYYVLAATHLMRHGLQSPIDFQALASSRDFATSAQGLHLAGIRPGTEIALAGLAAITRRPPATVYMPMSIAISMGSVCATGALAMQGSRRWWTASVAAALIVVSPMAGYGVMQQLMPQDWGLGLAAVLFAWLMRRQIHRQPLPPIADLFVISVLAAALFVVAYEVAASLVLGYALYVALLMARRQVSIRAVSLLWGAPIVATALVVNTFLPRALHYLTHYVFAFGTSQGFGGISQFGYAIVPSALPGAVGLRSLFANPNSHYMSVFIVAGACLFAGALLASIITAFRGAAAGVVLLTGFVLGIMLARNGNDFGLFKLYMYMQPFLAAAVAVSLTGLRSRRAMAASVGLLMVVAAAQIRTLDGYVNRSRHPIDLPNASASDLLPKFRQFLANATDPVVTVTDNVTLAQLEGASAGNKQLFFLSRNVFGQPWKERTFNVASMRDTTRLTFSEDTRATQVLSRGSCVLAFPTGSQLALNRRSFPEGSPDLVMLPCKAAQDVLAFIVSSLGQPATLPADRKAVSFWQLEPDPSFPRRTFSGFGRYALFQVLGPTASLRVALDFTTSPTRGDRAIDVLPPAAMIGADRVRFAVVGAGSARVVSPPLRPMMIDGRAYVVLDMGRNGRFPLVHRPGLTGLWGRGTLLDPRSLTSYVRDVSLVSPTQYRSLRAPAAIRSIPTDLANPNLEYSGIYEDGWIGADSYAVLASGPATNLVVRAEVLPSPGQHLDVLVDGKRIASTGVAPGSLDLRVHLRPSSARRRIELHWAQATPLRAPDGRPASARLQFIGFATTPSALLHLPRDLSSPGLVYSGIYRDGWLRKDVRLTLAGGREAKLTIRAEVGRREGQHLEVVVGGHTVVSENVTPGVLKLNVPLPASPFDRQIELRWAGTARIAPNDRRQAAALLQAIAVAPP